MANADKNTSFRIVGQTSIIIEETQRWIADVQPSIKYHEMRIDECELLEDSKEYHVEKLAGCKAIVSFLQEKLNNAEQIRQAFLTQAMEQ